MIPRKFLIPLRQEFSRIRGTGQYLHSPSFDLLMATNPNLSHPQVAFIVGKKISPSSVIRHQIKRRLSDAVAPLLPKLPSNLELVFLVKKLALNKPPQELTDEINRLIFN